MQIQNTHFKIYAANTKQQNAIYIKTNAKNNPQTYQHPSKIDPGSDQNGDLKKGAQKIVEKT